MPKTIKATLGPTRPAFDQPGKTAAEGLSEAMGEASMAAMRYGNGASNRAGRCISDLENHIARLNGLVQGLGHDLESVLGRFLQASDCEIHEAFHDSIYALQADLLKRATAIAEEFEALCLSRLS